MVLYLECYSKIADRGNHAVIKGFVSRNSYLVQKQQNLEIINFNETMCAGVHAERLLQLQWSINVVLLGAILPGSGALGLRERPSI